MSISEKSKVQVEKLRNIVDPTVFEFETTEEVPVLSTIIGQERGTAVMRFGLQVNKAGYNIYVSGIPGTGKTTFSKSIIQDIGEKDVNLFDWCYVYNFDNSYKPKMLKLPVGKGNKLKKDMEALLESMLTEIPRAFSDENYQKERATIIRQYKEKSNSIFERLNELAKQYDFVIRQSGSGFMTIPVRDGEPMSEQEYKQLPNDEHTVIKKKSSELEVKVVEFTNEFRTIETEMHETIEQLDHRVALASIGYRMQRLRNKYRDCQNVVAYLQVVQEDILKNVNDFLPQQQKENALEDILASQKQKDFTIKYQVNVLVDHSETKSVPIIIADNPTFYNMVGKVEYENRMGMMATDFTKIKPGYLHEANGGYMIIQAKDIISKNHAWEALKRALATEKLTIENIGEHTGLITTTSLNPDAIPLQVKIILIGNLELYQMLHFYDEDFSKLFKIKADFDVEMDYTLENMSRLASFIHTHCKEHELLHFDRSAVAKMVEYSSRLVGHQQKLSTRFNKIVEIIYEADTWAKLQKAPLVSANIIDKTIVENEYRYNLLAEKMQKSITEKDILIETDGASVGQVNGLAVYSTGQYTFGKPSRITATTFVGRHGIINIESESELSGNLHNKGVYILSGYLGEKFAQKYPLALTAYLTFEQSYGGVDGDSASSTELYALLSSLADVPIKQSLAVTGSVNQKGEIQPIGGVNEKIEGFFDICQKNGLTGEQGVIIPHQNVKNLMLKAHVVKAVQHNKFHIYAIKTIEEGIEILTGMQAGQHQAVGTFEEDTVYRKVADKLQYFVKMSTNLQTGENHH